MLRGNSTFRVLLTLLLSTMMALPAPAFAKDDGQNNQQAAPGATEGVPVILQQVQVEGKDAWLAIAPVPLEQEAAVVTNLAKHHPEDTILQVSGPDDPALKAAAKTGYLKHIKTYIVGSLEQSPLFHLGSLSSKVKNKLREKIHKISEFSKSETASGLMYSMVYAEVQGGFTAYASGSVGAGLSVATMFFLWNAMVLTKPEYWGKILDFGGRGVTAIGERVASLMGVELSEREKQIFEVIGKFGVSWAVTAAQGAGVKEMSGDFDELIGLSGFLEGAADSAVSGVQNNYNIWDAVVLKKYEEGGISKKNVQRYFKIQLVMGAILEGLAFRQVPYVGLFLGTVTALGLGYLALHPHKQEAVAKRAKRINVAFRSGVAYITNPEMMEQGARRVISSQKQKAKALGRRIMNCGQMLSSDPKPAFSGHRAVAWEDLQ